MGPAVRRQELQHYVPPHRSYNTTGGQWQDSTTQRSHWHDQRTASPDQQSGNTTAGTASQQQPRPPAVETLASSSLYDSGSWTDQVEEELGERLSSMTLSWTASNSRQAYSQPPSGGGYQSSPQPQSRQAQHQQHPRDVRSSPHGAGSAARDEGGPYTLPRGRGRGFQPRQGSVGGSSGGGGKPPSGRLSPRRWRDRANYSEPRYDRVPSGSADRDEEDRYSVVSSTAGGGGGGGRNTEATRGPLIDLRETLDRRRRQETTTRNYQEEETERQVREPTYNRGSQSSLNSLGRRKKNRGKNRSGRGSNSSAGGGDSREESSGQQKPSLPRPKKNTENFNPSYVPPEMRILFASAVAVDRLRRPLSTRDVMVVADLFGAEDDLRLYEQLLWELEESGLTEQQLWQSWHGDSHVIADDRRNWKERCPTFHRVLDRLRDYFDMDIKATRLNWYRSTADWKPFHHDAAALKPAMAEKQNFTVAVSFGAERDAAFEHAQTKTVIALPQPNGTVYTFGRDVNILWRHGIPQLPPDKHTDQGRISIIAWGWLEQFDL